MAAELKVAKLDKPLMPPIGKVFKLSQSTLDEWHGSAEARRLADAIVSFQLPSGGWSKAVAYEQPRRVGMQWTTQNNNPWHYAGTFDNRSTTEQFTFLAQLRAGLAQRRRKPGHRAVLDGHRATES